MHEQEQLDFFVLSILISAVVRWKGQCLPWGGENAKPAIEVVSDLQWCHE